MLLAPGRLKILPRWGVERDKRLATRQPDRLTEGARLALPRQIHPRRRLDQRLERRRTPPVHLLIRPP